MDYLDTSGTILADYSLDFQYQPQLFIVTGESGAGKTTACQALIHKAGQQGWPVAGLISRPIYQSEKKVAIDLGDIASGEMRRLAWKRTRDLVEEGLELTTGRWTFDPAVVTWGNQILEALPAVPLVILDELGPLEFEKQSGLIAGLRLLDERRHAVACVVVRPACLSVAVERWPWAQVIDNLQKHCAAEQL